MLPLTVFILLTPLFANVASSKLYGSPLPNGPVDCTPGGSGTRRVEPLGEQAAETAVARRTLADQSTAQPASYTTRFPSSCTYSREKQGMLHGFSLAAGV
jgi:hypothetical protein